MDSRFSRFLNRGAEVFSILLLLWSMYPILHYNKLPDQIPVHYNFSGVADAWGSRSTILILPIIALVIYIGFTVLQRFPQIYNYPAGISEENKEKAHLRAVTAVRYLKFFTILILGYLSNRTYIIAVNDLKPELGSLFIFAVTAISGVILIATVASLFKLSKK